MAYASTDDVQARMTRTLDETELDVCAVLLDDAAVMIDATGTDTGDDAKLVVSCRMVIRALGDGAAAGMPIGATQSSMTAGPYTQSYTFGSGGASGELYIGKAERVLLGLGNAIGARSPLEGSADT